MSESAEHSTVAPAAPTTESPLFSVLEIEQFAADDVAAGGAIGKMLSLMFLYTVLAMGLVTWWTFSVSGSGSTNDSVPATSH